MSCLTFLHCSPGRQRGTEGALSGLKGLCCRTDECTIHAFCHSTITSAFNCTPLSGAALCPCGKCLLAANFWASSPRSGEAATKATGQNSWPRWSKHPWPKILIIAEHYIQEWSQTDWKFYKWSASPHNSNMWLWASSWFSVPLADSLLNRQISKKSQPLILKSHQLTGSCYLWDLFSFQTPASQTASKKLHPKKEKHYILLWEIQFFPRSHIK